MLEEGKQGQRAREEGMFCASGKMLDVRVSLVFFDLMK